MSANTFVFVVCGTSEHIDTLHYSLRALKQRSKNNIVIITDSTRNEIPVIHDSVIDVKTPEHLNHHQASVFLKTGIHKFLPGGNLYCYLDTDVVALDTRVDEIFQQYQSPIIFAKDHCVMDRFSPSAIKCDCARQYAAWETELKALFIKYKDLSRVPEDIEKKDRLKRTFDEIKKNKIGYAWISIKFWLAREKFKLDEDTFYDKKNFLWHDRNGNPIIYERDVEDAISAIERTTPYRCDRENTKLWTVDGKDVFDCRCDHLQEQIAKTFSINVAEREWQHWNGGVFLFDDSSHKFLDAWHEKTMLIFTLPEWKTRDQGTLIATAWEFGLQRHKTLPSAFNLIADYQHLHLQHLGDLQFQFTGQEEIIKPHFIHVYHHWGDKKWDVWQAVEAKTGFAFDTESDEINSLWIGKELSPLELLTIRSFIANGHTFKLWLYDKLETPLPEGVLVGDASTIIPRDQVFSYKNKNKYGHGQGSYAGFSDIFRYKLLYELGGWWVDMDITCLKPFNFTKSYFFRSHHDMEVVGNVMRCPRKSKLMQLCYDEAIKNVDADNTDWHKPIEILNTHIANLGLGIYIEKNVSNHDRWEETSAFLWTNKIIPQNWFFIHWQNEEWRSKKVDRKNFYYRSAIALLLARYNLYQLPDTNMAIWLNKMRHSQFLRKIKSILQIRG